VTHERWRVGSRLLWCDRLGSGSLSARCGVDLATTGRAVVDACLRAQRPARSLAEKSRVMKT